MPSVEALVPACMRVKTSGMRNMPSPAEKWKNAPSRIRMLPINSVMAHSFAPAVLRIA